MSRYTKFMNWISIPALAGGPFISPPCKLHPGLGFVASAASAPNATSINGTNLGYNKTIVELPPQTGLGTILGGHVSLFVTGNSGTNPTAELFVEGTDSITDLQTQATAAVSAVATSITVASATGFAIGDYAILYETDGSQYEWVQITNIVSLVLTVTRAVYGTTANAYNTLPFVGKSTSWTPIPTGSASTPTMDSGAVALSGGTVAAPQIITLDMQTLGMDQIDYNWVRARVKVGGTNTPQLSGYLNAAWLFQSDAQGLGVVA